MGAVVHCLWPNAESVLQALDAAFPDGDLCRFDPAMVADPDKLTDVSMLVLGGTPPDGVLDVARSLKVVQAMGAGVDHLLPIIARRPDLVFTRVVDPTMPERMADYVLAALFRHFRRLDRYEAVQDRRLWRHEPQPEKRDFPVGVLGLGHLGRHVARRCAATGFPTRGWSRRPNEIEGVETFAGSDGLAAMADGLACLVVLLPLTPATEGLVGADLLRRLAPGAALINVARGALLDDQAVLAALESGQLAGATLDVFAAEPLPPENAYWAHPNVLVTPHVSCLVDPQIAAGQIAENHARLMRGEPVQNIIDPATGY